MDMIKILWADDEIDLLKPQLLFLEKKGYDVITVSNGHDALEECEERNDIDVVFLDESMPGLTGLETLSKLKESSPNMPVVMITKNEAETVMEEALGSSIADYLIKPVNPNQILLTLKKIVDNKRLISEKTATDYQMDFRQLSMQIMDNPDVNTWVDVYKKIIYWELKLNESNTSEMSDILDIQKTEANRAFSKFIEKKYPDWIGSDKEDVPIMSHNLMSKKVFSHVNEERPTVFLLLDNLRMDQWKILEPIITDLFRIEEEDSFYSILPTTTQYSRNAIFAGLMPSEIQKHYPDWWRNDMDEGGKNSFESQLLEAQLNRVFHKPIKHEYIKVTNVAKGKQMLSNAYNYLNNDLTVIVYNFIDMLSHARTEMEVLKELAGDEAAYRSLTQSWFLHSYLWEMLQNIAEKDVQLFIATDHGTIRVQSPSKVIGDKDTTTNLRYKVGRNLKYANKDVLEIKDPSKVLLPKPNISSTFIFAKEDKYFLYPNNYNHYNAYYKNTFQHGGISLEEMVCPIIRLVSKNK
jgi:CheY-like chemotaxis protein